MMQQLLALNGWAGLLTLAVGMLAVSAVLITKQLRPLEQESSS